MNRNRNHEGIGSNQARFDGFHPSYFYKLIRIGKVSIETKLRHSSLIGNINFTGYALIPDALSHQECDTIAEALVDILDRRSKAGARHLMSIPAVNSLAQDPRLVDLASLVLSEPTMPFRATLFDKSPDANWLVVWHQDTALPLRSRFDLPGWGPWSEKAGVLYAHAPAWALEKIVALRVHVDHCGSENGPLRVIPGSHRQGVLPDGEISALAKHERPVDCLLPKGGILVMRPLLIHASSKCRNESPRRVLHIEYAPQSGLGTGIELAVA